MGSLCLREFKFKFKKAVGVKVHSRRQRDTTHDSREVRKRKATEERSASVGQTAEVSA